MKKTAIRTYKKAPFVVPMLGIEGVDIIKIYRDTKWNEFHLELEELDIPQCPLEGALT